MVEYIAVSVGGAIGALLRFIITQGIKNSAIPYSTMVVNVVGSFFIGMMMAYVLGHEVPPWVKVGIVTGGLGGLTTFSTFSYETVQLLQQGDYGSAAMYVGIQLVLGITLCGLGFWLGKTLA